LILRVQNINTYYGKIKALSDVSIRVNEGQIVSILGANGAGKSTLLMAISGIIKVKEGQIYFFDKRINDLPPSKIVQLGVSQVPEGRRIFPDLTVEENLRLGAFSQKNTHLISDTLEIVYTYFPVLLKRRKQRGSTLSGGEQQMLAISRGLMSNPKLLLLDEPSLGLAPKLMKDLFKMIKTINASGTSILIVEQNVKMSLSISDYAYVLVLGRVSMQGSSAELIENDEVRESYLSKGKFKDR
jgi:branched-chain amino acid transport system ATP-binding protein